MQLIRTIEEYRRWRQQHSNVAIVPTMGNLHEGHLSLVREATQHAEHVVVTIFVNPIQFGEGEDFDSYPRTLEEDLEKLKQENVSVVFHPDVKEMYPKGSQRYFVEPPELKAQLCGRTRPIHFQGVCTVVSKLFHIVEPQHAFFGKKDYQQFVILKNMIDALNFNIEIHGVPIKRDTDGLALSSRNRYLSDEQRSHAIELYKCLEATVKKIKDNVSSSDDKKQLIKQATQEAFKDLQSKGWQPDYVEVRERSELALYEPSHHELIILAAAKIGTTRLIDNLEFDV